MPVSYTHLSDFLVGGLSGVTLSGLKGAVLYLITGTLLALLLAADLNVLCPVSYTHLDDGFDYYAPQSFAAADGRRIPFGWMGMRCV